ncbi:peptidase, S9A/B/C family, catalytic domain protein [Candidatus Magnetomorum sp. HK-1]|nr:peptidase, S9A/B/C family, catalytic domain protein [Candidatus Magnetomorum sp. HK-1]
MLTNLFKILGLCLVLGGIIYAYLEFQQSMIYHPRHYDNSYNKELSKVISIEYETSQGKQTAYYYKGQSDLPPKNLWVFFCGNKSLAMDWFDRLLNNYSDISSGFLLFDYPGFGKCEGKSSPKRIRKSADKALETLYARYSAMNMKASSQLNVLGHSLGAAVALDFAARHPCKRVIILAPFTSLSDMARRVVGVPFCYGLSHRLDNHDRLLEIAQQSPQPLIILIHGRNDRVIPIEMGKKLSESFPSLVNFVELAFADHGTVITQGRETIYQAMDGQRMH